MKTVQKTSKLAFRRLAPLIALTVLLVAAGASATPKSNCIVTSVGYDVGRLSAQCSGDPNIYYAFNPESASSCPHVSQKTAANFMSLLQSALLSGRPVSMDYTANSSAGCGIRTVNYVRLY